MGKTGIVRDERYMEHDPGPFHVETPRRLEAIYRALDELEGYERIASRPATVEEVAEVHDLSYIKRIEATAGRSVQLDPDTATSPRTYEIALLAAGGLLKAVEEVMEGRLSNAFALIRPPGHHAERSRAMGFCIFNNVAIAARYAMKRYGVERVLIVDWDLHHGNGTQNAFWKEKEVLYFSTHQYPYYPGTGHYTEVGEGEGKGYTVNCPLRVGCTDSDYANIYRHLLRPIAEQFKPQLILVSAGFDIYHLDPLGGMKVTEEGFARLTDLLLEMAGEVCDGRLVITLEGGYHLEGIARSVREVVRRLLGEVPFSRERKEEEEDRDLPHIEGVIETVKKVLSPFWGF